MSYDLTIERIPKKMRKRPPKLDFSLFGISVDILSDEPMKPLEDINTCTECFERFPLVEGIDTYLKLQVISPSPTPWKRCSKCSFVGI